MTAPDVATNAVFVESEPITSPLVRGYEFSAEAPTDFEALLEAYGRSGFQATNLGKAFDEINRMLHFRFKPEEIDPNEEIRIYGQTDGVKGRERYCKIFMGCTSNLISSGMREVIKFIVKHHMIDVLVMTAGGVEEDIIKCLAPTHMGEFHLEGKGLREKGWNRIGNLIVPNENYCKFEDWIMPILDKCVEEQTTKGMKWTPSRLIRRFGQEINNEDSVIYWCARNGIPVYSPALTDGSIGDMIYFHSYNKPGLVLDLVEDIRGMNNEAVWAKKTGVIILGGGVIKHHIMNANLFRDGADFAVYVNTSSEFDGSDSGARPDEAVSWGKIQIDAHPVKVYAEVSLILPLIVAKTFAPFIRGENTPPK